MDRFRTSALSHVLASGLLVVLGARGGGADTVRIPPAWAARLPRYTGPPPATADVQAFKINVWDNLKATNRCGQCHVGGGQTPQFVRQDDVPRLRSREYGRHALLARGFDDGDQGCGWSQLLARE